MTFKKPINLDSKRKADSNPQRSLPSLLQHIRDHAISKLDAMFAKMLDDADDTLFDLADKARSNKDQTQYFDSMRELRIKRKGMARIFSQQLSNKFLTLQDIVQPEQAVNLQELGQESLSLVQEDQLEENLALDAMVNKALAVNETGLKQLVIRFDTLLANAKVDSGNNPVGPLQICNAFRDASERLDINIKVRLVIYKLFDRLVVSKFDSLYQEINSFLINSGVLPDLTVAAAAYKNPSEAAKQANSENVEAATDAGADFFGTLRELLTEQRGTSSTQTTQQMPQSIDNRQLVQALSKVQADVQRQFVANESNSPSVDIRNQIGKALDVPAPAISHTIGQATDDVIGIISMLFDFILDDKNLPNEFKALIGRLQIPMLKVAIIDHNFLSKRNHPARILLNEMAHAGVGWSEGSGIGLKDKVEQIVNKIIDDFEDDISLFASLLEDLQSFNEQHSKRAQLIEKRIKEAEEGKAKAETAKFCADKAIREIVDGKPLPDAIHQLLFEDWLSVMSLTYLREGDLSEAWEINCQIVEQLIASFSPSEIKAKELARLVKNIQAGLDTIGYGEYESVQLFKEMQKLHHRVLAGESIFKQAEIAPTAAEPSDISYIHCDAHLPAEAERSEAALSEIEQDNRPQTTVPDIATATPGSAFDSSLIDSGSFQEDDEYITLVDKLQAGSWFELADLGNSTRCKLAAVISSIGKYIFVNHTGKKIAEYNKLDLALAFRRGEITQLDDGALFDRALQSIVSNFRTKKYQDAGM